MEVIGRKQRLGLRQPRSTMTVGSVANVMVRTRGSVRLAGDVERCAGHAGVVETSVGNARFRSGPLRGKKKRFEDFIHGGKKHGDRDKSNDGISQNEA